ncbi:hypothetical protein CBL_01968 [Carabus blaptoides fortunei]
MYVVNEEDMVHKCACELRVVAGCHIAVTGEVSGQTLSCSPSRHVQANSVLSARFIHVRAMLLAVRGAPGSANEPTLHRVHSRDCIVTAAGAILLLPLLYTHRYINVCLLQLIVERAADDAHKNSTGSNNGVSSTESVSVYAEAARLHPGEYLMNISGSYNGELFEARFTRYIIPGFPRPKQTNLKTPQRSLCSRQHQAVRLGTSPAVVASSAAREFKLRPTLSVQQCQFAPVSWQRIEQLEREGVCGQRALIAQESGHRSEMGGPAHVGEMGGDSGGRRGVRRDVTASPRGATPLPQRAPIEAEQTIQGGVASTRTRRVSRSKEKRELGDIRCSKQRKCATKIVHTNSDAARRRRTDRQTVSVSKEEETQVVRSLHSGQCSGPGRSIRTSQQWLRPDTFRGGHVLTAPTELEEPSSPAHCTEEVMVHRTLLRRHEYGTDAVRHRQQHAQSDE